MRRRDLAGLCLAAAPLRGTPIVVQHEGFPYLEAWLGLRKVATLEPKPGVEASSAHLAGVLRQLQAHPARMVLRAAYNDGRSSAWLAQRTGLPEVVLPYTVGGNEQASTLFSGPPQNGCLRGAISHATNVCSNTEVLTFSANDHCTHISIFGERLRKVLQLQQCRSR